MLGGNKQLRLLNLSYEQMGNSVKDYKCEIGRASCRERV